VRVADDILAVDGAAKNKLVFQAPRPEVQPTHTTSLATSTTGDPMSPIVHAIQLASMAVSALVVSVIAVTPFLTEESIVALCLIVSEFLTETLQAISAVATLVTPLASDVMDLLSETRPISVVFAVVTVLHATPSAHTPTAKIAPSLKAVAGAKETPLLETNPMVLASKLAKIQLILASSSERRRVNVLPSSPHLKSSVSLLVSLL